MTRRPLTRGCRRSGLRPAAGVKSLLCCKFGGETGSDPILFGPLFAGNRDNRTEAQQIVDVGPKSTSPCYCKNRLGLSDRQDDNVIIWDKPGSMWNQFEQKQAIPNNGDFTSFSVGHYDTFLVCGLNQADKIKSVVYGVSWKVTYIRSKLDTGEFFEDSSKFELIGKGVEMSDVQQKLLKDWKPNIP